MLIVEQVSAEIDATQFDPQNSCAGGTGPRMRVAPIGATPVLRSSKIIVDNRPSAELVIL